MERLYFFAIGNSPGRDESMTIKEVSERYCIPMAILREYESWGLCSTTQKRAGAWQYDDADLEHLSLMMTLLEIGFAIPEVKAYSKLAVQQDTEMQCIQILNQKRYSMLEEIHCREKQLEQLDDLRCHLRKQWEAKQKRPSSRI